MKMNLKIKKSSVKESKKVTSKNNILVSDQNLTGTPCSLCAIDIPYYIPEYSCGESYNPACQAYKAGDSSWDPKDPFSAFPSPTPPISLVSHWLVPPKEHPPQHPSSIISLRSHCLTEVKPNDEANADFKEWLDEFCEQLRIETQKILEELQKDFSLFKSS